MPRLRAIAFYLPQFHPIPENDEWWGRGFTEWRNVAKAKPLFHGHYQPHLPADLGFYDLRLSETRAAQAALAQKYGIEAFCYWHYWFNGRRLLERPFNKVLASGEPDFPFCLAWANESWSRRWLGEERNVLAAQTYSAEDDVVHARWLLPALADRRCVKVHGRPVFLIYRPQHLPNPQKTTDIIRTEALRAGLVEPWLLGIDAHCPGVDCRTIGFDGTVNFSPQLGALPLAFVDRPSMSRLLQNCRLGVFSRELKIYDYADALQRMHGNLPAYPVQPSVFVGWDNTPRRGSKGVIVINNDPRKFGDALRKAADLVSTRDLEERIVFINAWNEWAEGNHLEPDLKNGLAYLEQVRDSIGYKSDTE